jgi:hypothetical protein
VGRQAKNKPAPEGRKNGHDTDSGEPTKITRRLQWKYSSKILSSSGNDALNSPSESPERRGFWAVLTPSNTPTPFPTQKAIQNAPRDLALLCPPSTNFPARKYSISGSIPLLFQPLWFRAKNPSPASATAALDLTGRLKQVAAIQSVS